MKKMWRNLKCILLSQRGQPEEDFNYRTFWKRQNYGESKKISGARAWGRGGRDEYGGVVHRGFLGQWNDSVCCYYGGFMSFYICPNPQNVHYPE